MKNDSRLEPMLRSFEFPGEEERLIRKWLDSRDFASRVVEESRRVRVISPRSVLWGVCLVAAVGAGAAAIGSPVAEGAGTSVTTFASLLMGAIVTASVVGLLATLHPSWHRGHDRGGTDIAPPDPTPD